MGERSQTHNIYNLTQFYDSSSINYSLITSLAFVPSYCRVQFICSTSSAPLSRLVACLDRKGYDPSTTGSSSSATRIEPDVCIPILIAYLLFHTDSCIYPLSFI